MRIALIIVIALFMDTGRMIYDFGAERSAAGWMIVDDVVMGGRSDGGFFVSDAGHGVFHGTVSLENYGGFSSVRYRFPAMEITDFSSFVIRLKGDGKRYQFRAKSEPGNRYSFTSYFETSGDWEEIEIPFSAMWPIFRGTKLPLPNYKGNRVGEIGFLIANKRAESFRLEIDYIRVK
jgi:hypothetical protein